MFGNMFSKWIASYKKRYYISYLDLADSGESNRIIVHLASIILFLFALLDSLFFLLKYKANIINRIDVIVYYSIFFIISILSYFLTKQVKNTKREKAYIKKTIPFYLVMYTIFAASIYSLKTGQSFNGFIAFCLTAFIALCTCSFSPIWFLTGLIITVSIMTPELYKDFRMSGLLNVYMTVALMFCLSLYKRRIEKKQIQFLKKQKQNLEAKTFGNFTLIYENKVVKFSRTKSQELMGYLIYKKGSSVKTKELISILYGEHADSARYGSSLRNLIVDIKHTLGELEIQNFFIAEYNNFRINPEVIKCDYYDFLAGDISAKKSFAGEFMSQYSWAEEATDFLEQKALK